MDRMVCFVIWKESQGQFLVNFYENSTKNKTEQWELVWKIMFF